MPQTGPGGPRERQMARTLDTRTQGWDCGKESTGKGMWKHPWQGCNKQTLLCGALILVRYWQTFKVSLVLGRVHGSESGQKTYLTLRTIPMRIIIFKSFRMCRKSVSHKKRYHLGNRSRDTETERHRHRLFLLLSAHPFSRSQSLPFSPIRRNRERSPGHESPPHSLGTAGVRPGRPSPASPADPQGPKATESARGAGQRAPRALGNRHKNVRAPSRQVKVQKLRPAAPSGRGRGAAKGARTAPRPALCAFLPLHPLLIKVGSLPDNRGERGCITNELSFCSVDISSLLCPLSHAV